MSSKIPDAKRPRRADTGAPLPQRPVKEDENDDQEVIIRFCDPCGECQGPELRVPLSITKQQLEELLNRVLNNEERQPYTFSLEQVPQQTKPSSHPGAIVEVVETLVEAFRAAGRVSAERSLFINYFPLAVFRVRPVTHLASSLEGHTEAVLALSFSPDSQQLASGSGDTTVRIWDMWTQTPRTTCKGHSNWVLCVSWSPDGSYLASAGMDTSVRIWTAAGKECHVLSGHTKPVTCLVWQPVHLIDEEQRSSHLASASKDCAIRVWDVVSGRCLHVLTSHTNMVTALRWSGHDWLLSSGRDRLVKVWDPTTGRLVKDLKGHAHWVNHLALNTDQVLKTGPFDHHEAKSFDSLMEMKIMAKQRFDKMVETCNGERLVSCSDDFTIFLWNLADLKAPVARMTGHQQLVNCVCFSPDGRFLASASFDKSIRLWDGRTGKYVATLRGHVGRVFQVGWSADSRMLVSASSDSTVKVWDAVTKKLKEDLPGHADEVYAIEWAAAGGVVASGSKDRVVKIWKH